MWEWLQKFPQKILDGIRDIFIPDTEQIETEFNSFLDTLKMKFSFNTDFFESVLSGEQPVADQTMDYTVPNVGTFHFKVLDSNPIYEGVTYFRPFIRGFIVLLLCFYNIKMTLSFIKQDAGVVTGKFVGMGGGKNDS